jgi:hypothetical protein
MTEGPRPDAGDVLGLLSLIIGLYAVRHVLITLLVLAVLLGIFWIINGTTELFLALSRRDMAGRGWTGVMGAFSIVAGLIVLADPGISLLTLAIVLGVWLLVFGAMETTLNSSASSAPRAASPSTGTTSSATSISSTTLSMTCCSSARPPRQDYQDGGCVPPPVTGIVGVSRPSRSKQQEAFQWQRSRPAAAGGPPPSSTRPASSRTSTTAWAS